MEYMGGWLRVRVPLGVREMVDRAAAKEGLSTSLWVRLTILAALGEREGLLPVVSPEPAVSVQVKDPEPVMVSPAPAAVQPTPDRTEQQKAAEAAHWEKVARMQKIKGAGQ